MATTSPRYRRTLALPILMGVVLAALLATLVVLLFGVILLPVFALAVMLASVWAYRRWRRGRTTSTAGPVRTVRPS